MIHSRTCCSLTKGKMLKESKDFVFANNCLLILQHTGWVYEPVTGVDPGELCRECAPPPLQWPAAFLYNKYRKNFVCHPLATSFLNDASPPQKKSWIPLLHAWWEHKPTPHKHGKTQLQVYKNWITYNSVSVYSTHAHCLQLLSNSIPDTDLKIALTRSSWGKIPLHVPIHFHIRLKKSSKT